MDYAGDMKPVEPEAIVSFANQRIEISAWEFVVGNSSKGRGRWIVSNVRCKLKIIADAGSIEK